MAMGGLAWKQPEYGVLKKMGVDYVWYKSWFLLECWWLDAMPENKIKSNQYRL